MFFLVSFGDAPDPVDLWGLFDTRPSVFWDTPSDMFPGVGSASGVDDDSDGGSDISTATVPLDDFLASRNIADELTLGLSFLLVGF